MSALNATGEAGTGDAELMGSERNFFISGEYFISFRSLSTIAFRQVS